MSCMDDYHLKMQELEELREAVKIKRLNTAIEAPILLHRPADSILKQKWHSIAKY